MIDVATIKIQAGNGGDGAVTFRREKFIARGGPDGGDGGDGGNVYLIADNNMATLSDFRSRPMYRAVSGEPGNKKKMYGEGGKDLVIHVPIGTLIYELREGKELLVADMKSSGEKFLIAQGGGGGKGNYRFKSSTNQTPYQYTKGTPGEFKEIKMEVRLIADVGLVGLPNAGKTTLINQLTNVNAKVANYPFTTLSPNLGVYRLNSDRTLVIADIPGLIEGAAKGKGLGDEFLRHIQRTSILIHIVDPLENSNIPEDISKVCINNYKVIRKELVSYGAGVDEKPEIVCINKADLPQILDNFDEVKENFKTQLGKDVLLISAYTGKGLNDLTQALNDYYNSKEFVDLREKQVAESASIHPIKVFNIDNMPNRRMVLNQPDEMNPSK